MESLIDHEHGPTVLIACLVFLLAIHLLWKIFELALDSYKEKIRKTDDGLKEFDEKLERFSTLLASYMETTIRLGDKMEATEKRLEDLMKIDGKIRKINSALKILAGDEWQKIREQIFEDDIGS